jgi:heme/copper-type cytochrome/quinol oxidase subunit 2
MWSINNIFDLYQTVYNTSIKNEIISKRGISSYDIVVIIFLSFICLMIFICIITVFIRYRKRKKQNDLNFIKNRVSKSNPVENNIIETPSHSDSIQ